MLCQTRKSKRTNTGKHMGLCYVKQEHLNAQVEANTWARERERERDAKGLLKINNYLDIKKELSEDKKFW